ncbi:MULTISPECIES: hypothetical protein [unclassified Beijerinckia]|uniref:hypothetical protein n=1 Tax=unclassified Beijerinckia TaxID=2638183 RepID=UPI001114BB44|nr:MULTISPECIES: hypothetical protein [unclassified Beijerinckia]MDH7796467.1 hypothetical protein [Beijerinckia sp. GAS462]
MLARLAAAFSLVQQALSPDASSAFMRMIAICAASMKRTASRTASSSLEIRVLCQLIQLFLRIVQVVETFNERPAYVTVDANEHPDRAPPTDAAFNNSGEEQKLAVAILIDHASTFTFDLFFSLISGIRSQARSDSLVTT